MQGYSDALLRAFASRGEAEAWLRAQRGQGKLPTADWVRRKDSPTRQLLAAWCQQNRPERLLRAVEGLNPALGKALQDRDRGGL